MPEGPFLAPALDAGAWDRYVGEYHDARPGITEDVLAGARDDRGRSPYDWLVEAVPPDAATVVDLACGSGPVGRLVGARRVVGVDRSAGELARAQAAAPDALLVRACAAALPLGPARADAVVVSMALMLLSPLEAVLAEAARLLRPGGVFAATVPVRAASSGAPAAVPFSEILDALGQGPIEYPEPLAGCSPGARLAGSGLTLCSDRLGVFRRTVQGPGDAERVVHSFYAPEAGPARVAAAVAGLQERVATGPVEVAYRIRRLVARR
jgi:SAM-dependent methyltransferase